MYCEHLPTLLVKKITLYDSPTIWTVPPSCSYLRRTTSTFWFLDVCRRYHSVIVYIFLDPFPDLVLIQTWCPCFYFWVCCLGFSGSLLSGIIVIMNYYSLLLTCFKGSYPGRRQIQWCNFFTSTINSTL